MVENNKIRRALTRAFVTVAHFVRRFQRGDYRARTYQKKKTKKQNKKRPKNREYGNNRIMSRYFSYCAFMLSVVVAGSSYIGLCAASGVIFITFLGTVPSDLTFVTPRRNARRKKRPYLPQPLNYTIHTHTPLSYSFRTHPFYLSPVPFPSATRARQRFSYFRARPIGPLKKKKRTFVA